VQALIFLVINDDAGARRLIAHRRRVAGAAQPVPGLDYPHFARTAQISPVPVRIERQRALERYGAGLQKKMHRQREITHLAFLLFRN
jgi:hypothetical protein